MVGQNQSPKFVDMRTQHVRYINTSTTITNNNLIIFNMLVKEP